mmetsp:Transcript_7752/g.17045  ORF Transcript_7752/g.17045 Transcript_7752/m.17045 type:complete len:421 (+) Transcript_7752:341-1603(+)
MAPFELRGRLTSLGLALITVFALLYLLVMRDGEHPSGQALHEGVPIRPLSLHALAAKRGSDSPPLHLVAENDRMYRTGSAGSGARSDRAAHKEGETAGGSPAEAADTTTVQFEEVDGRERRQEGSRIEVHSVVTAKRRSRGYGEAGAPERMHERRRARSEGERLRRRSRGEQSRGEQRGDGNGDGNWDGDSDGDGNGGTASNSKTEDAHAQAVGTAAAETAETAVSTETVDAKAANTEDPTAASAEDATASQMVAPTAASARVPFERAFYINADGSALRRAFMQQQLNASGVRYERWPALLGGPRLLRTHARYFKRGVEKHLYVNHTKGNELVGWGTIGTYLSHLLLFEHILQRWKHDDSLAFLILQDDTQLRPRWLERTRAALRRIGPKWQRVLLVWWGLQRESACGEVRAGLPRPLFH